MMPVGFAVGGHVNQLWLRAFFESRFQARDKPVAGVEQPLKGDGPRDRTVIEEDGDGCAGSEADKIRMRGVDRGVGRINPIAPVAVAGLAVFFNRANPLALVRSQHGESNPICSEGFEGRVVGRGFRQPHAFRRRAKAILVVGDSPADLRGAVASVGQRQNHVVVNLRHGRTVPAVTLAAAALAIKNHAIGARRVFLEPTEERGSEVKADARVVIDDAHDLIFHVEHAGRAVGRIALGADALVPVVVRSRTVLRLHRLQPGILARRLIKVAVNTNEAFELWHEDPDGVR